MTEKPDKPEDEAPDNSQPEEKKKPLREITDEELQKILAEHKKWLESKGKEGEQAVLEKTNLKRKKLHGANLQHARLDGSDLSGAHLSKANLQNASLGNTILKGTLLWWTELQEANLRFANLQGAVFFKANLQNASLLNANFEEAILTKCNLEDAVLGNANLRNAVMFNIKGLHTANLQDCILEGATGLKGTEFARADITGAKLPEDIRDFKILKIVEETSKNARKIFLAMLLGCAYSWLTIFTTTDVNLLTNSSSSPLPIIRTAIPIAWFYLTAPILLVGFYLYMHFYLHRLWEGLAGLPARFEDGKRLDERAYPWLLNGLVRRHFDKIKSKRLSIARLEEWVSIILAWWVVPFTICCFWLRYIPRHDWTGTIIHMGLITLSIAAGIIFYSSHARTLRGYELRKYQFRKARRDRRIYQFLAVILIGMLLIVLSYGSINGIRGEGIPTIFRSFGYDVFANFREKDVSTRPDNYWLIKSEDRANSVIGANLFEADLRQANAVSAFMAKADLRGAKLHGARLYGANLEGAILSGAHLEGAILLRAEGLSQEQLSSACGDNSTLLPPGRTIPNCPKE